MSHIKFGRPFKIILGLGLCVLFILLVTMAFKHQESKGIKGEQLHIVNLSRLGVLQKKNLEHWLFNNPNLNIKGKGKQAIDLKKIERQAELNPWVANAEVYIDNKDVLQIDITERHPVARIFDFKGASFYLDSSLAKMPVIPGSDFETPVFTNVVYVKNDSLNHALNAKMVFMANIIGQDSFWNAQIEQIVVQPNQNFVLIPLLGKKQQIIFGDTSEMHEKLSKLMAFYKHVSPKIGWNNYRKIDLRFEGQIVASPTLGVTLAKAENPLEHQPLPSNLPSKKQ